MSCLEIHREWSRSCLLGARTRQGPRIGGLSCVEAGEAKGQETIMAEKVEEAAVIRSISAEPMAGWVARPCAKPSMLRRGNHTALSGWSAVWGEDFENILLAAHCYRETRALHFQCPVAVLALESIR